MAKTVVRLAEEIVLYRYACAMCWAVNPMTARLLEEQDSEFLCAHPDKHTQEAGVFEIEFTQTACRMVDEATGAVAAADDGAAS